MVNAATQSMSARRRTNMLGRSVILVGVVPAAWTIVSGCVNFVSSQPRLRSNALTQSPGAQRVTMKAVDTAVDPALARAKDMLMDLVNDETLAEEVLRPEGKPMRGRVDEAIVNLERMNPTEDPAYDEGIDGEWVVKYSGSYAPGMLASPTRELALFLYGGGYSLGAALSSFVDGFWGKSLGMKLGEKKVTIKEGRDVEASAGLTIAGMDQTYTYTAELLPLSGKRLSEEILELNLPDPLGKQDLPIEMRRSILVTYLDDEVMIVRDESGVAEVLSRISAPASAYSQTADADDDSLSEVGEDPLSAGAA